MRTCVFLLFMAAGLSCSGWAAPVTAINLKNGQHIEGEVIEQTAEYIKINVEDVTLTYFMDEIDTLEKVVPAIIVKDEAHKQEVINKIVEEGAADVIYDIQVEKKKVNNAQEAYNKQFRSSGAIDAPGKPLPNVGIQFVPLADMAIQEGAASGPGYYSEDMYREQEEQAMDDLLRDRQRLMEGMQ